MQKIYYDKVKNHEVIDLTGKKTLGQIKQEQGESNYQVLEIEDNEPYKIEDGKLRKWTQKELNKEKEEAERKALIGKEKDRILEEQAIENLKKAGKIE